MWGHSIGDVPEGHCLDCEDELPLHHEACPIFEKFIADA